MRRIQNHYVVLAAPEHARGLIDEVESSRLSRHDRILAGITAFLCIVELIGFSSGARQAMAWPLIGITAALAVFISRTIKMIGHIKIGHTLRRRERAGLLIRVPAKLVIRTRQAYHLQWQNAMPDALFDHDLSATRKLVQLYRQNHRSSELKRQLDELIQQHPPAASA